MKAILEFSLPEEQETYELHAQAPKMHSALYDFWRYIRQERKHGGHEGDAAILMEKVVTEFWEIMKDNEVSL